MRPSTLKAFGSGSLEDRSASSVLTFGALAEFEREIIRERTQAGLASDRRRSKVRGRPKTLTARHVQIHRNMASDKSLTVSDICKTLGIGRTTVYRYVKTGETDE